jgi:hypothetical protein
MASKTTAKKTIPRMAGTLFMRRGTTSSTAALAKGRTSNLQLTLKLRGAPQRNS